jgi:exosortase
MSTTAPALETPWKNREWIIWPCAFGVLICILYAPILKALILDWWTDPDYGHGFLVPLISGYVLRHQRSRWLNVEIKPSNFGFLVMLGGIVLLLGGSLGAELFTSRFSLLVLLAGMVLFLAGWKTLRAVSFPLGFLVLMIPIPVIIYNQITFPLQLFASRVATSWLELLQVPVLRDGNVLILPNYSLEVVEACSGVRSLMTLITLAIAYGYLIESRRWVRYALAFLMIPIAIVSNAFRITGTGVLTYHFGLVAAEGFFHEFSGWIIFLASLVMMFVCHLILRRIGNIQLQSSHA